MMAARAIPIWIDVANSPHVLFFRPIIAELQDRGEAVVVSARDFAQTVELCRLYGIEHSVIGVHGGASLKGKSMNLVERARALRTWARPLRPCVAVSHNSYAQLVAARMMRLPAMTAMDYEYQPANHLAFRAATLVAVPEVLPAAVLARQGASARKTWRYPGLKEEVALAGFAPSPDYLRSVGLDPSRVTVVVRPPADFALYHRFSNTVFGSVLEKLASADAQTVLLARTDDQAGAIADAGYGDLLWKGPVLDGREIIAAADLVISAGGTMNREAALLGVPAVSVYAGRMAAVDQWLEREGRLVVLRSEADVGGVRIERRHAPHPQPASDALVQLFVERILALRGKETS
jgi:predicted glycosyltransferase